MADFEGEQAVGLERGEGLGDEAAIDVEAGGAGEEGQGGFVVADLGVEGVTVGGGNIGRVGDHCIKDRLAGDCAEQVGDEEVDAAGEVMEGGVGGGDFERGGGDVGGGDVGVGQVVGQGDGDGARAGADVEDCTSCGSRRFA